MSYQRVVRSTPTREEHMRAAVLNAENAHRAITRLIRGDLLQARYNSTAVSLDQEPLLEAIAHLNAAQACLDTMRLNASLTYAAGHSC